jgi:hypothetical protein
MPRSCFKVCGIIARAVVKRSRRFLSAHGAEQVLTYQRLNGIAAILAHTKLLAVKEIDEGDRSIKDSTITVVKPIIWGRNLAVSGDAIEASAS